MSAAVLCGLGVWLQVTTAAGAQASESTRPAPIALTVRSCSTPLRAGIGRVLALELRDIPLVREDSATVAKHQLIVRCNEQAAEIAAQTTASPQNPAPPHSLIRLLNLNEFLPDDQARAVALAAVELLAALDSDIRRRLAPSVVDAPAAPPPPVAAEPAPALVSPAPAAAQDVNRTRVDAHGAFRAFLAGDSGLRVLGGGAALSRRLRAAPLVLAFDADLGFGQRENQTRVASAWMGSLGVVLGAARDYGPVTAEAGAGLRVGGVRLRGEGNGETVLLGWTGPLGALRFSVQAWRARLTASFEAGVVALGVQGNAGGQDLVSAKGLWLGVGVGVGTGF